MIDDVGGTAAGVLAALTAFKLAEFKFNGWLNGRRNGRASDPCGQCRKAVHDTAAQMGAVLKTLDRQGEKVGDVSAVVIAVAKDQERALVTLDAIRLAVEQTNLILRERLPRS